jgi:hypothetical protein
MKHSQGWRKASPSAPIQQVKAPEAHVAAATGGIDRLIELAKKKRKALYIKDANGWQPLHEAVRAGHTDIVLMLISKGANKDARIGRTGKRGSPLNLALSYHSEDHPVTRYLLAIGASPTNVADGEL